MGFTTEQAKSVFDLIKTVSPFAYPLLISLIFPIIWITYKKLLGLSNNADNMITSSNRFKRIYLKIIAIITLTGNSADKFVFYCSLALFLFGGVFLKFGEHHEEVIRQNALALKKYFETENYLFINTDRLNPRGFDKQLLNDILYNFPNDFVSYGDTLIICTDTTVTKKILSNIYPLLESYLTIKLAECEHVSMDSLFQSDSVVNVKNFFTYNVVYSFLCNPKNIGRFNINVINNQNVILKGDVLKKVPLTTKIRFRRQD